MKNYVILIALLLTSSCLVIAQTSVFENNAVVGSDQIEPFTTFQVAGHTLINTDVGSLRLGYPNNGNRWSWATSSSGANLLLSFKASNTFVTNTRYRFNQDGATSFGSHNPLAWLHIRHDSGVGKPHLKLEETGNDFARLEFKTLLANAFWHVAGYTNSNMDHSRMHFYYHNGVAGGNLMTISGNGNVGINNSSPSGKLQVNHAQDEHGFKMLNTTHGNGYEIRYSKSMYREGFNFLELQGGGRTLRAHIDWNSGNYSALSDERHKKNIQESGDLIDKISKLQSKKYQYKNKSGKWYYGFLAQELQPIFPELITQVEQDNGDIDLLVDYSQMTSIALGAIHEQQEIIEEQASKISMLEKRLISLEKYISSK